MHLPDSTNIDLHMRGRDCLRDREVFGVCDTHFASARDLGSLIEHLVCEVELGLLHPFSTGLLFCDGAWCFALEDVFLACGEVLEDFGW